MTVYLYPPDMDRVENAGKWLEKHEPPEAFLFTCFILQIISWISALIMMGFILWGDDKGWLPSLWMPLVLAFDFWPFAVAGTALEKYSKRRALALPSVDSNDYGYNSDNNKPLKIAQGARAYELMPDILREGTAPAYAAMYKALGRYHVANEPAALEAAAKRGQLLIDVKHEGVLTRASQIDITDESDLNHGREIVQEMQMMRKEIEG